MSRRPLVVIAGDTLLDEVAGLSVAAGVEVDVVRDPAAARSAWRSAPLVVVGADVVARCDDMERRPGVVVVAHTEPPADVWRAAVTAGAEAVLALPAAQTALIERLGDAAEAGPAPGRVACCIGGCGGAGASVLAAGLALTAARSGRQGAFLVDLDPYGGGLDLAIGGERADGLRWPDLRATSGRLSARSLIDALPTVAGVSFLSSTRTGALDIPAETARTVIAAGRRAGKLVIVDLPRVLTPAARTAVRTADLVLLVVPAEVRASMAASLVAQALAELSDRVRVVVRGPGPAGLAPAQIAESLNLPLAGQMRTDGRLATALDRGQLPLPGALRPLTRLCRDIIAGLGQVRRHGVREAA